MAARPKAKTRLPPQAAIKRAADDDDQRTAPVELVGAGPALKLLVFVSGAVLMGLEIVGSRILAPSFGNSVFVWGSLISLFLIALSAGYYFGGRVADRWPSRGVLGGIVIAVALAMFGVAFGGFAISEAVQKLDFGDKAGPFVASALLFLLPSIGMGIVSPYAIRLATHNVASVGKTAGTLYALSTLGSIAGTMLTTFVLIPSFGAGAILKGLAAALLVTAVGTFPFGSVASAARGVAVGLATAGAALYFIDDTHAALRPGQTLLREIDTPYHHISVIDDEANRVRELRFDRYTESAIDLDPPHYTIRDRVYYTNYFHLAFLAKPEIRRAAFIGAGGGVGPRAFRMHDAAMEIDVVDIDEQVLRVAQEDFFMPVDERLKTFALDGRTFVRQANDGHYDALILDAFTIGGRIPFHLATREFFTLCRQKLASDGVFVMNINSAMAGPKSEIYRSIHKSIAAAFPRVHVFALGGRGRQISESRNIIFVAVNGDAAINATEWSDRAASYSSASYIDRPLMEYMVGDLVTTIPDLQEAALFTDEYAPIETMSF